MVLFNIHKKRARMEKQEAENNSLSKNSWSLPKFPNLNQFSDPEPTD